MTEAATDPSGRILDRLDAALVWRQFADEFNHESQLKAYVTSLNLLDAATTHYGSLETQYQELSQQSTLMYSDQVAVEAAAIAINQERVDLAIVLLEQGRARLFSQLGRYRTTMHDLEMVAPELAIRFSTLSGELDALAVTGVTARGTSAKAFEDSISR